MDEKVEKARNAIDDIMVFSGFTNDSAVMISYERGLESARPDALFTDPFSRFLIGKSVPDEQTSLGAQAAVSPGEGGQPQTEPELKSRGQRLSEKFGDNCTPFGFDGWREFHQQWTAVRTRFIDDQVIRFCGQGGPIKQLVNLGSGFDMRAYRLAEGYAGLGTSVEVDMKVLQGVKQKVFEALGMEAWFWDDAGQVSKTGKGAESGVGLNIRTEPHCRRVHNVVVDLLSDSLDAALSRSYDEAEGGDAKRLQIFSTDQPALFVAEGLIMYLGVKEAQTKHFLDPVSRLAAPGSGLVLNFMAAKEAVPGEEADPIQERARIHCHTRNEVRALLAERGWGDIEFHSYGEDSLSFGRYPRDRFPKPSDSFSFVVAKKERRV
eukprot:Hpha_TRINITY_DN16622_c4_g1::TRINITY_DN16622_c4_g1_i1::g.181952::m.181952